MNAVLPWLESVSAQLAEARQRDRLPHALLIHGPAGSGRRLLAFWLASEMLDFDFDPGLKLRLAEDWTELNTELAHPDLAIIQPEPDKRTISIEQVRELIPFMHLTSHQEGAKVGLIAPAEVMTRPAANSLLKTLEEPPAGSMLILISESLGALAPTVVSRCQRLRVGNPPQAVALRWLETCDATVNWVTLLNAAGGSPLKALQYARSGFGDEVDKLHRDLASLAQGGTGPAVVAARWARGSRNEVERLKWLYRQAAAAIRAQSVNASAVPLQNGRNGLNMSVQFSDLREISNLIRQSGSGLNMELQLSGLLTRLYGGQGQG